MLGSDRHASSRHASFRSDVTFKYSTELAHGSLTNRIHSFLALCLTDRQAHWKPVIHTCEPQVPRTSAGLLRLMWTASTVREKMRCATGSVPSIPNHPPRSFTSVGIRVASQCTHHLVTRHTFAAARIRIFVIARVLPSTGATDLRLVLVSAPLLHLELTDALCAGDVDLRCAKDCTLCNRHRTGSTKTCAAAPRHVKVNKIIPQIQFVQKNSFPTHYTNAERSLPP